MDRSYLEARRAAAFDMALKISAKADTICARTSRRRQPLRYHRR